MAGRDRVGCQTIGHVYLTTNFDSSGVNCAKECNSQMVGGGGGFFFFTGRERSELKPVSSKKIHLAISHLLKIGS